MRRDIQRWVRASFLRHFYGHIQTELGTDQFVLYAEGMPKARFTTKYSYVHNGASQAIDVPVDNFFELRVDGPVLTNLSKDYWKVFTEVNVLISVHIGDDLYKMDRHCGIIQSGFSDSVQVTKVGDGGEYVGCLRIAMNSRARQNLVVSNFGQIHPVIPILQSTVEGHYVAHWSF